MTATAYDRMSRFDAGYLSRETADQPLHFVLEFTVAGHLDVEEVRAQIAARLSRVPLLRRRVRYPLAAGLPVWVDDPDFDVRRQVVQWDAPVSDQAAADDVLRRLTTRRLSRDRPLWQLVVGSGAETSTTLWLCMHHSLMDGGLLIRVLGELFRVEVDAATPSDAASAWRPKRAPSRVSLLALVVWRRVTRARGAATSSVPSPPSRPLGTSLAGPVSSERAVAHASLPLSTVRQASKESKVTVNDLMLLALTDALRAWLPEPPETVLALVPRDVRTEQEAMVAGNRGWSILVPLLTGTSDRDEQLSAIRAAMLEGKSATSTAGTQGWTFDVSLSNLRLGGPFACTGKPIVAHRAGLPLQGSNRLAVLGSTLDDQLTMSVTSDVAALPGAVDLAERLRAALTEIALTFEQTPSSSA